MIPEFSDGDMWRNEDYQTFSNDMVTVAIDIVKKLREAGFSKIMGPTRQVFALAEECGEFVGAYRRYIGQARRSGTAEEMEDELADVIIVAYCTAIELNIDINKAIDRKLTKIFTRGWRE